MKCVVYNNIYNIPLYKFIMIKKVNSLLDEISIELKSYSIKSVKYSIDILGEQYPNITIRFIINNNPYYFNIKDFSKLDYISLYNIVIRPISGMYMERYS